ncbi:unnamed protein product, partial [Mesorhabditis spiculigera]
MQFEYFSEFHPHTCNTRAHDRQEAHLHFLVEQQGALRHYGVILREWKPLPHQPLKGPDHFDVTDINQLAMDEDYHVQVKAVEDIDANLEAILLELAGKVDFSHLLMIDPTPKNLQQWSDCLVALKTTTHRLQATFTQGEMPTEMNQFLWKLKGSSSIKLIADAGNYLPAGILKIPTVIGAETLQIELGHFSAEESNQQLEAEEDVMGLRGKTIHIRGARITPKECNRIIKRWLSSPQPTKIDIKIAIDSARFSKEEVFDGIQYEPRNAQYRGQYLIERPNGNGILAEQAVVSYLCGNFTLSTQIDTEKQLQRWFF